VWGKIQGRGDERSSAPNYTNMEDGGWSIIWPSTWTKTGGGSQRGKQMKRMDHNLKGRKRQLNSSLCQTVVETYASECGIGNTTAILSSQQKKEERGEKSFGDSSICGPSARSAESELYLPKREAAARARRQPPLSKLFPQPSFPKII